MSHRDREVEIERLRRALLASEAKVHELEETVARCLRRGASLRGALQYYTDIEGPAQEALKRDRATGEDE